MRFYKKNLGACIAAGLMLLLLTIVLSDREPSDSKELKVEIEGLFEKRINFGQDTSSMKVYLDSILMEAEERRSIPLKWAYYQLMADGFSIAHDGVNPRSDHYYRLAEQLIEQTDNMELQQVGMIREGYYFFVYRDIPKAFPWFLRADDMMGKVRPSRVPFLAEHYGFISGFFSFIGNHRKAARYLMEALPYTEERSRKGIDMLNSIGVFHERDSLKGESIKFYRRALGMAELVRDSVWIGILSGNLSSAEWESGHYSKAVSLVKRNINYSTKFNEPIDAMRANLALAGMYVKLGRWDSARAHVEQALPLMENKPYFLPYMTKAKKVQADIAHGTGNSLSELGYLSSYMVLNDSLERLQDRQRVLRVSWQWEAEKYRRSIKDADLKRKQVNLTFLFVVGFVVLFLLIIILSVNGSKNKIRLKNAELEGEQIRMAFQKELVDRELGELQNSLQEFTRTIQQNDQTIQRLRNEVIRNLDNFPEKQETLSENIEEIMGGEFMNEERWTKFQDIFERVYPGYLDLQKQSFQPLSQKELRLLALIKLGLNNRSMASLLGITLEGVKKAKQRLKKKQ